MPPVAAMAYHDAPMETATMRRARPDRVGEAEIADLTHEGRGVARVHGKVVFIDGALPGERVRYERIRRKPEFDTGRVLEVLRPAPDRVAPGCPHFGVCGGCVLQHLDAAAQIRAKQKILLDNLERIGSVRPARVLEPLAGPAWGYRARARLGVKYVHGKGRVLVGFRERNKRYVADLAACPVLAPPVDRLLRPLGALIGRLTLRDRIPQVEVAVGADRCALVLRVLAPPTAADREAMAAFEQAHGVDLWLQPKGPRTAVALREGTPLPSYALPEFGLRLAFSPTQFTQINPAVNQAMVRQAVRLLAPRPQDRVLDLFCGLGNFSLPLARHSGEVVGVEGEPELVARARANARDNRIGNARFVTADLSAPDPSAWGSGPFQRVLLDPPRTGAREALGVVAATGAARVMYVSCNPATLARDAGILAHEYGLRLEAAGVMDMFPHTAHVESMALFLRP